MNIYKLFAIFVLMFFFITPAFSGSEEIDMLLEKIQKGSTEKKIEAIDELGSMGINATKRGAIALIPLLNDENRLVRNATMDALSNMKWEAQRAVPALIKLLKGNDAEDSYHAALALENIGNKEGLEALEKYKKRTQH